MRTVTAILNDAQRGKAVTQAEAGLCVELEARSYAVQHKVNDSEARRAVLFNGSLPAEIVQTYLGRYWKVTGPSGKPKDTLPPGVREYSLGEVLIQRVRARCHALCLNPDNAKDFATGYEALMRTDPDLRRLVERWKQENFGPGAVRD